MSNATDVDYLIIGGGFYGCCLALYLRSISNNIMLLEAENELLTRASRVNQARIHTGFHYPRNAVTAVKSMVLHRKFATDFPEALDDSFQMLYAIGRTRSKVSAKRFFKMFKDMGAPIAPANPAQAALFNPDTIESSFACMEYAFDYSVLRRYLSNRLDACNIDVRLSTEALALNEGDGSVLVRLSNSKEIRARYVFNVTYAHINNILKSSSLPEASLKYELAEIALVKPPSLVEGYGITVMDGPFFSIMPYPAASLYSLTHVRYTPHKSWKGSSNKEVYEGLLSQPPVSNARYMILDAQRYVPCLKETEWKYSLYDIKAVLLKNEYDDGRPILYQRNPPKSRVISIMGGKIDNIYDLFELIKTTEVDWRHASSHCLFSQKHKCGTVQ